VSLLDPSHFTPKLLACTMLYPEGTSIAVLPLAAVAAAGAGATGAAIAEPPAAAAAATGSAPAELPDPSEPPQADRRRTSAAATARE
jgi:hypothetical protein